MNELFYDRLLNIKTRGEQERFIKSFHYHRYEPTPYSALKHLFNNYHLSSSDRVVDFGCGKGRLNFYIHYLFQSTVVGIEMNDNLYQTAVDNRSRYLEKMKKVKGEIYFHCCLAEEYEINQLDNRFYFFNPFSIQIFMKIIRNIMFSVETTKREVELVLYYVSEDYLYFLENGTSFELKREIILPSLYEKNPNERFLIYRLAY